MLMLYKFMTSNFLRKTFIKNLDVEMLVIRALSLNLVEGVIDEVDERVHMTWVQPRVLNNEQVQLWPNNCPPACLKTF